MVPGYFGWCMVTYCRFLRNGMVVLRVMRPLGLNMKSG
jgi:hypothetical protein